MDRRRFMSSVAAMAAAGSSGATGAASASAPADARLRDTAARYFAEKMDLDPLSASAIVGGERYEGRLEITIAPDQLARARRLNERVLGELQRIDPMSLGAAARLDHELLTWEVQLALDSDRFPGHLMPIDQFGGLPQQLASLAQGDQAQPLKTTRDHENYLRRLARLPAYAAQAIENLREGARQRVTVPGVLVDRVLPDLQRLAGPRLEGTPWADALKRLPVDASRAERDQLVAAYRAAYASSIRPAMMALIGHLKGPYRQACRRTAGWADLPDGHDWYAYLVRLHTTTEQSPEAIHALGLQEVARIRADMAALQPRFGFRGPVSDFLRWHVTQRRFMPHRTWDDLVRGYEALHARVAERLPMLFDHRPKAALAVRAMPELQRATQNPYYNPPAPDGSRPGIFFVGSPLPPHRMNDAIMTALLLHEGEPGHHFQVALQQEMELPDFRRFGWNSAYGEGWALYAESLGHELGLYGEPNQHLGFLKLELTRAVRLVADTGLHARRWSRERTLKYIADTEGNAAADARLSTERYMAFPGQALSYKIGALAIQDLRREATAALGAESARAFHNLVLGVGAVPLTVLRRLVHEWIAQTRGRR